MNSIFCVLFGEVVLQCLEDWKDLGRLDKLPGGLGTVRSMAVAVAVSSLSLSVDCSDFKDPGVLANNGFLRLSRFKFLVGGGRIVGFGCIGFNKDPAICGL